MIFHGLNPVARRRVMASIAVLAFGALAPAAGLAASATELNKDADAALQTLYEVSPSARELADRSLAVLVFPKITKAGFVVGAQIGNGVLRVKGKTTDYFNITAGSYGLQAGAQTFSYALFFVTKSSLDYLKSSNGWQIGSGPSVVVLDQGMAKTLNTTTLTQDVYAMIFGQKGLMAGVGLEGSKISRIQPGP